MARQKTKFTPNWPVGHPNHKPNDNSEHESGPEDNDNPKGKQKVAPLPPKGKGKGKPSSSKAANAGIGKKRGRARQAGGEFIYLLYNLFLNIKRNITKILDSCSITGD
jgi:hypothetical protein